MLAHFGTHPTPYSIAHAFADTPTNATADADANKKPDSSPNTDTDNTVADPPTYQRTNSLANASPHSISN